MRKASPHTALRSKGIVALAAACAACVVALAGAQAADAAFSVSGATAGATSEQTAQRCRGDGDGGPCYPLAVELWGSGHVTSIVPAPVPGATGAAQYPNGHIECLPSGIWDCVEYFNWSFGDGSVVIFQAHRARTSSAGRTARRPRPAGQPLQDRAGRPSRTCIIAHRLSAASAPTRARATSLILRFRRR